MGVWKAGNRNSCFASVGNTVSCDCRMMAHIKFGHHLKPILIAKINTLTKMESGGQKGKRWYGTA